jgi:hypothetical protein
MDAVAAPLTLLLGVLVGAALLPSWRLLQAVYGARCDGYLYLDMRSKERLEMLIRSGQW